jgi:hypothetical protein
MVWPAGTVEIVKPLKMYDDPSGGVPPLEERIKAVEKLLEPRLALIAVEAKCKEDGDDECEEVSGLGAGVAASPVGAGMMWGARKGGGEFRCTCGKLLPPPLEASGPD